MRMIRAIKITVAMLSAFAVTACSWLTDDEDDLFRDRGDDYRQARVEAPLVIPEHLQSQAIEGAYDIPKISDNSSLLGEFDVPRPETLGAEVLVDAVRINKLGEQQWILIDGAPGEIWPRLRSFLSSNNLPVARADAVSGLIETDWLQPVGDNALRERFRLRIEQGVQRETTEVHVLQADARAEDEWPAVSSNSEREALIVNTLSQYLADNQISLSSVSMLAQQAMGSTGKVSLEENQDRQPYIQLELPFVRAWASLGLAIQKAGFDIEDLDRSQRVYYIRFAAAEEGDDESGFWRGLFSGSEEEGEAVGQLFTLRMHEQDKKEMHIFVEERVESRAGETGSHDENESTESTAVSIETVTDILKRVKKHLS